MAVFAVGREVGARFQGRALNSGTRSRIRPSAWRLCGARGTGKEGNGFCSAGRGGRWASSGRRSSSPATSPAGRRRCRWRSTSASSSTSAWRRWAVIEIGELLFVVLLVIGVMTGKGKRCVDRCGVVRWPLPPVPVLLNFDLAMNVGLGQEVIGNVIIASRWWTATREPQQSRTQRPFRFSGLWPPSDLLGREATLRRKVLISARL